MGPTRERLDPVRFISNYSTGDMGAQLVGEALARGHRVRVVSGPVNAMLPREAHVVHVERAQEMERAMRQGARQADVVIMAAAVADFRPARRLNRKLKRQRSLRITLNTIPDIVGRLPRELGQLRVGFALETDHVLAHAEEKLHSKRLDLVVAQAMGPRTSPFGRRALQAWLLSRHGDVVRLGKRSKAQVARLLLDKIERLCYGQPWS